jgi:hypothetical protein
MGIKSTGTSFLIAFLLLIAVPASAELPPLYEGEIGVCNAVERDRLKGETLEDALKSLLNSIQTNDPEVLGSMRRTILHNAIRICNYDPVTVIAAAYEAGLSLELVVGAAIGAGINKAVVAVTLNNLGVDPQTVASAIDLLKATLTVDLFLPAPFTAGSGLGQASPFAP